MNKPGNKDEKAIPRKEAFAEKVRAFRAATGRPERFAVNCACAVHDRGFIATYERMGPGERWRIASIVKIAGHEAPAKGQRGAKPRVLEVAMADVDNSKWACPWCGHKSRVYCIGCHTIVCGRRVREEGGRRIFHCRDSCGESGGLEPLESMTGAAAPSLSSPGKGKPSLPMPGAQVFPKPGGPSLPKPGALGLPPPRGGKPKS